MSDISRRWIIASVIASVIGIVVGLLDFPVRGWLEAGFAETPFGTTLIYAAFSAVLVAVSLVAYAWFTGMVLLEVAPALPWRQWLALHLAIGVVLGFGLGLIYTAPTGEAEDWGGIGLLEGALLAFLFVAACMLLGAISGALQAVVLRRAAVGMRVWIAVSAVAVLVMASLAMPIILLYPSDGTFAREVLGGGAVFVATIVESFVMLPALHRLRPRAA